MKKNYFLFALLLASTWSFSQDTCYNALEIIPGLHTIAAIDGSEFPTPICTVNGTVAANGKGKWFSYTPTDDYTVIVTTDLLQNTPRVDTRVHI